MFLTTMNEKLTMLKGKSLSEALIFAEHGENMLWTNLPRFKLVTFMY